MYSIVLSKALAVYKMLLLGLEKVIKKKSKKKDGLVIVLTGNFYSDEWILSQLEPLSRAENIATIYMVAEKPVPEVKKVQALYAPGSMASILGKDVARMLYFVYVCVKIKPDVIGGYHLLLNGLFSLLAGRLVGARTLYVCGGGITEVDGGGYATENKVFGKLKTADKGIEKQLHYFVSRFDFVVVRGTKAKQYFVEHGSDKNKVKVITAGIDTSLYKEDASSAKIFDVVFIGRISEVKQLNLLIEAMHELNKVGEASLVVVGDGPGKAAAEKQVRDLSLANKVTFAGWSKEPVKYLQTSRVFALPSKSEGMSQAMLQAMACSVPVVINDVGDLSDAVKHGESGILIDSKNCTSLVLANSLRSLISGNSQIYREMSTQARLIAEKYDTNAVAASWEKMLRDG